MKESKKSSIQKDLITIIQGKFNENNVSSFMMSLREYASENSTFIEFADFIAHSRERHKGLVQNYLENKFNYFKYYFSYVKPNIGINFNKPIPKYLKPLFISSINELNEYEISSLTKRCRHEIIENIKKSMKNNNGKSILIDRNIIKEDTVRIIKYGLRYLSVYNVLSTKKLFDETLEILTAHNISVDVTDLENIYDKFILCLLYKLHDIPIKSNKELIGECFIGVDQTNFTMNEEQYLGKLVLFGKIEIPNGNKIQPIVFTIMETSLLAKEYCSNEILKSSHTKRGNDVIHEHQFSIINDIILTDNFKIEYTSKTK